MCKVLIIEDQSETIERFQGLAEGTELNFLSPADVRLAGWKPEEDESVEEQLAKHLRSQIEQHQVDLVLLDTDLSRGRSLQPHSSYKAALRELGMPVCRYQKGGTEPPLARLQQLQRTVRDGASAIWIPKSYVSGDRTSGLVSRLIAVSNGFKDILAALKSNPQLLESRHSPADVLANVLGDADLSYEFLGYAAQNLIFFAEPEEDVRAQEISEERRYATQLGYWLYNYIITFSGPILTASAAAAYLNVHPDELYAKPEFHALIGRAQYNGPFDQVEPYYWRSHLITLLNESNGDIAMHDAIAGVPLRRVDSNNMGDPAYVCMISGEPITQAQAATSPDWVPSGASEAKIAEDVLDELGPLAGI
jgi:CheY-like chemotaxis protein